ncbi:MAG: hypothetical protein CMJ64_05690 [Planctomycetaceae bacterium]|nr:hypothetical protein [Planctomycetaceae bacterium]
MSEYELNQQAAEQIRRDFKLGDQRFQNGQCVALLDGKVIAVKENMAEALKALRTVDSTPDRGMLVTVTAPAVDVIR